MGGRSHHLRHSPHCPATLGSFEMVEPVALKRLRWLDFGVYYIAYGRIHLSGCSTYVGSAVLKLLADGVECLGFLCTQC